MNRRSSANFMLWIAVLATTLSASCARKSSSTLLPKPTAFGAAIVESSGGKQVAQTGALLPQPLVVQVNDEQGNAVAGALVELQSPRRALTSTLPMASPIPADSSPAMFRWEERQDVTRSRHLPPTSRTKRLNSRLKKSHWAISKRWAAISTHNIGSLPQSGVDRRACFKLRQPGSKTSSLK